MKNITKWILVLSLCSSNAAYAMKCGNKLVTEGDYRADVLAQCGEPDSVETHTEIVRRGLLIPNSNLPNTNLNMQDIASVEIQVEEWVYNLGRSRLQQYLRFENGKLTEINSIGRGN